MACGVLLGLGRLLAPNIAGMYDVSLESVVTALDWGIVAWVNAGGVMLIVAFVRMVRGPRLQRRSPATLRRCQRRPLPGPLRG